MLAHLRLATQDGSPAARHERAAKEIAAGGLQNAATLVHRFVEGAIDLF
jgi:hypothetical protein